MLAKIANEMIHASLVFVLKIEHAWPLNLVSNHVVTLTIIIRDALNIAQTEAKYTAKDIAKTLKEIKNDIKSTTAIVQRSATSIQKTVTQQRRRRQLPKKQQG